MSKLKNPTVGVYQNMQEWSGGDLLTLVVVATCHGSSRHDTIPGNSVAAAADEDMQPAASSNLLCLGLIWEEEKCVKMCCICVAQG